MSNKDQNTNAGSYRADPGDILALWSEAQDRGMSRSKMIAAILAERYRKVPMEDTDGA